MPLSARRQGQDAENIVNGGFRIEWLTSSDVRGRATVRVGRQCDIRAMYPIDQSLLPERGVFPFKNAVEQVVHL